MRYFWFRFLLIVRLLPSLFLMFLTWIGPAQADGHFDHQLVMLPEYQYVQFGRLLKDPNVQREIGATWKDDPFNSDMKGFLYFEDGTYLEIWNAYRAPAVGYQEAYRITDRTEFDRMAILYGKIPIESPGAFSVFGLYTGVSGQPYGGSGNPFGGLFYIWYPTVSPRTNSGANKGIVKIVKQVPTGAFEELVGEYLKAGISTKCLDLLSPSNAFTATDSFGLQRTIVRAPFGSSGKLLSIEFTRNGMSFLNTATLELRPGVGKLIFP